MDKECSDRAVQTDHTDIGRQGGPGIHSFRPYCCFLGGKHHPMFDGSDCFNLLLMVLA